MNQILNIPRKINLKYAYIFMLYISLLIIFFSLLYMAYLAYIDKQNNTFSLNLLKINSISKLYSKNIVIENDIEKSNTPFIIGTLDIPSINLKLPVISETSDELLQLSVCRFFGPKKISKGNMCIAGHNYNNGKFFSDLPNVSKGEKVNFMDFNNTTYTFTIYDKYEISSNDTNCTSQYTDGRMEITLITCNNFNGNRIVVKAK